MKAILILALILNCLYTQAQFIKAYATKEDYMGKKYENPGNLTLRTYQKADQKLARSAEYYFWSDDNSLRYQIGLKTFLVEYNDSLYINTHLLRNEKGKRLSRGFSKVNVHNGIFYFHTILKGNDQSAARIASFLLGGVVGAALITKGIAQKQPIIFYCFNLEKGSLSELTQKNLLDLLEEDEQLLSLFKKEPNPQDNKVIALYAEAFFLQKKPNP